MGGVLQLDDQRRLLGSLAKVAASSSLKEVCSAAPADKRNDAPSGRSSLTPSKEASTSKGSR